MNQFFHQTPFFRITLALTGGIFLADYFSPSVLLLVVLVMLCLGGVAVSMFFPDSFRFRWLFGVSVAGLMVLLGMVRMQESRQQTAFPREGMKGVFLVEVTDAPVVKAKSVLYQVRLLSRYESGHSISVEKMAYLYVSKDSIAQLFDLGDRFLASATFAPVRATGNPGAFDFNRFLQNHGIAATGYAIRRDIKFTGKDHGFSFYAAALHLRSKLLEVYHRYHIDGDPFAVVAALTLGYNEALSRELRDSYSVSGTMHVLSVSGLHVGIIYGVLYFLLGFMRRKRRTLVIQQGLIIVCLWGFAFLTGLAPAVVRATLMFSLVAAGRMLIRKPQIMNTVFFSAFVMLLLRPTYMYDVGFQLSYIAVISIVYFTPRLESLLYTRNRVLIWLWRLLCVSMAAQIGTSALGIFYFHRFATFFWMGNLFVVPAAAFVIYLAIGLLILSPFPVVASFIAVLLKWLLNMMNGVIRWIESLPCAAYNCWIDAFQLFISFGAIIALGAYCSSKRFAFLAAGLSCVFLFFADSLWRTYAGLAHHQAIILADSRHTHVDFLLGNEHYAITADSGVLQELEKAYYLQQRTKAPTLWNKAYVSVEGKHFLVTNDSLFRNKTTAQPLPVDYLILGNRTRITFDKLYRMVKPRYVIIDQTISPWYSRNVRQACDSLGIACTDMKQTGAVRIAL
ncbi:ComEC/Rec2 family competence protein [Microbacter margulisiae]|uniref:Competence protein ComEC n=1 Tax=Microbacter margulisiae TaxID=1350067 RepID=A0A7W5H2P8_9PORP|nr:ComEC/Rec2 family competence protein [Microbacter margulisiae]MBB3187789.1 competence protein ComEC [Microbacter margulisiae]